MIRSELGLTNEHEQMNPGRCIRPRRVEWLGLVGVLGLLFGLNVATCDYYPTVWCDEVSFSEPAINRVKHGSFTTTIWKFNRPNTFPVVNCPLYPMALVPWLAVTGTTLLAVRSFNYALMAVCAFLIWLAAWRFGLVRSSWARLALVVVLHLGYGISFSYRCCRPDMLGMLCLLLIVLALSIPDRRRRGACMLLLAAVSVWIGLQVALYAAFGGFVAWLVLRRVAFMDLIALGAGMLIGAATLVVFLCWHGVFSDFFLSIGGLVGKHFAHAPHASVAAAVGKVLRRTLAGFAADFSALMLTLGLVVLLVAGWKRLTSVTRRQVVLCLILVFGAPVLFNFVGHFAMYYCYLRFVPAAVAFFAVYSALACAGGLAGLPLIRGTFLATVSAAILSGLPLRLALALSFIELSERSEVRRVIASHVASEDVVFSDYAPFFEVKRVARTVYAPWSSSMLIRTPVPGYDLTVEQKQAVSVLVIRPEEKENLTGFFGGSWRAASEPFGDVADLRRLARLPVIGRRLVHYANQPQNERYQVQMFRRVPEPAVALPATSASP